ncbi:hypothetical protein [Mesobacillus foraminis]|uniref:hypothetical protein n=1 Tax=Mesobacillus foraminis TaxID=279826 RepID=UPI000EF510FB|nr:hypothetical protein [Mesobacillus foraminis]
MFCKTCNVVISKNLDFLKDTTKLNKVVYGKDYIPEGFYILNDGEIYPDRLKGWILINVKDLINSKYHYDKHRLNGCCGKDGLDGNNKVCLSNHEIGTEMSDCWELHLVALDPNLVEYSF